MMALMCSAMLNTTNAQTKVPSWINNVKLSGYVMTQYQYSNQSQVESNGFNTRFIRMSLDGRIMDDWYWKIQLQANGNTSSLTLSPRVVDAFAEWQRYEFFKVKAGQFKRPFTFESPLHPIDQGFMGFSQNVNKLSYFADRSGAVSSNGRDLGLQVQGDFLKNAAGRNLIHYQVGVFNGQGINTKDLDQRKDIVGGVWVMPVEGMRIGVFGSEGSYARQEKVTDATGATHNESRSLPQHRYALSAEYKFSDWTVRSEYIHSTGKAFKTTYTTGADATKTEVNEAIGNKADGVYALVIAPVIKQKLYAKARYDLYRQSGHWGDSRTQYEVGANYLFNKNIQLNAEYARINDRTLASHNYDMVDVQLDFRF